jgi:hypothetical protein
VKSENFTLLVDVAARFDQHELDQFSTPPSLQQSRSHMLDGKSRLQSLEPTIWTSRRTLHSCSRSAPKLTWTEREQTGTPSTPRALAVFHIGLGSHGGSAAHPTRTESGDSFFSRSIDSGCGVRLERSDRSPMSSNEMMGGYAGGTEVKMV